jgi:gliding motility-associated-like protein
MLKRLFLFAIILISGATAKAQLIINEFSQGSSGTQEYMEFVVVGTRTCTDSTADLRGWIFDDQCGWYGGSGTGIATGHHRFANVANWQAVPYGSIILVYNDGDMNTSITQAPDPTDANNDYVYILPVSSTYLEENTSVPSSPSSPGFAYGAGTYNPGGAWTSLGLSNSGDAVIVVKPTNLTTAYHSILYGVVAGAGFQTPTIQIGNVAAQHNCYLTNNLYTVAANYTIGNNPGAETPGAPNTVANAAWINAMRVQVTSGGGSSILNASICNGQPYTFNGTNYNTAGTYNIIFPVVGGCDSTVTLNLTVNPVPITTAGNNGPVCEGAALNLTATAAGAGATYSWTGPNSFTANTQNPTIAPATTLATGTYSVTATLNGCTSAVSTTNVTVNASPAAPTATNNGPLCITNNLNLTASNIAGATYTWTGPAAYNSNTQNPTITNVTGANGGTYSVVATVSGCNSQPGTTVVVIIPQAPAPFTGVNNPTCTGGVINLTANAATATDYSWTGPNAFTSNVQNPTINNATLANAGVYSVVATVNGCPSAVGTVNVNMNQQPSTPTAGSNSPICLGNDINLTTTSAVGANYSWAGPNAYSSTTQNPTITPSVSANTGTYTITITVPGCVTVFSTVDVKVVTPPTVAIQAGPRNLCLGDTFHLYTLVTPAGFHYTYSWTPAAHLNFTNTPDVLFTAVANDTVRLVVTDDANCKGGDSAIFTVTQPGKLLLQDATICPNDTIQLTATATNPLASVKWTPNIYISDTNVISPRVWPVTNIRYTLYAVDVAGCKDTGSLYVKVVPEALLHLPDSATIYPGQSYHITPGGNCLYYQWTPSLGLSYDNISDPTARPDFNTIYHVLGTTENGCTITDSISIRVAQNSIVDIPNAFAPGTGANNKLKIIYEGTASLKNFTIYNRWGNKVFETVDINEGWDGKFNGEPQPMGVYIYVLEAYNASGERIQQQGNITLVR